MHSIRNAGVFLRGAWILPLTREGQLSKRTPRDVLQTKGYQVHFQEVAGGHDYLSWRGLLANGLIVLMSDATTRREQKQP